jgi:RimJ/RimL family protein N-acetyltransferase
MASDVGYTDFSVPGYFKAENLAEARLKILPRMTLFSESRLGKFPLFLKGTGDFIGTCGLENLEIKGERCVELGYRLLLEHWGKGLATEAAKALLGYGHDHLKMEMIYSIVLPQNQASLRVLARLGMEPQGEYLHAGLWHKLFVTRRNPWLAAGS